MNKRLLYNLIIFFHLLLISYSALGQKKFFVENYTTKNGLPENNVQTMIMDKEGFLWSSYGNGIMRFDGRNFRKYFTSSTPYISLYLYKTFADEMLIADASGSIFRIKNHKEVTLRIGKVNSLNYLIIKGTMPGTDFYLQSTTPHINKARDRNWFYSPLTIFPLSETDGIIRTKKGIGLYHNKSLQKEIDLQEFSPDEFLSINGNVYFFSKNNKLFFIDKNLSVHPCGLTGDLLKDKLFISSPSAIFKTFWDYNNSDPCALIADHLYYLQADSANPLLVNSELITDRVPGNSLITSVIYNAQNRVVFIGTDTKGLFIFKEQDFKTLTYDNPENGTDNVYYCQLELDSNTVFTDWNREFTIDGGVKSKLPIEKNYSENIFRDRKGFLWYEQGEDLIKYNPSENIYKKIYSREKEFALSYFRRR